MGSAPWRALCISCCVAAATIAAQPAAGQSQQPPQPTQQNAQSDEPEANPGRPTVSNPATLTPVGYLQFETGTLGATEFARIFHLLRIQRSHKTRRYAATRVHRGFRARRPLHVERDFSKRRRGCFSRRAGRAPARRRREAHAFGQLFPPRLRRRRARPRCRQPAETPRFSTPAPT